MSDFGPKMQALTPMQRAFVTHFAATGGSNKTKSAVVAGYSPASARTAGCNLAKDQKIIGAIREVVENGLGLDLPEARLALSRIILDPMHKDHFSAVKLVLGIGGFSPTAKTEHIHSIDTDNLAEQIKMLEAQLPVSPRRRLNGPTDEEEWTAP
jgi:Terminase small subunit